jgi:hypothetical protein
MAKVYIPFPSFLPSFSFDCLPFFLPPVRPSFLTYFHTSAFPPTLLPYFRLSFFPPFLPSSRYNQSGGGGSGGNSGGHSQS